VRLDRFWAQQDAMYDWTAELTRTEDRSELIKKVIRLLVESVISWYRYRGTLCLHPFIYTVSV